MALRWTQSLPTMMVLQLVAMVAMLGMEAHLAVAAPGFLGVDGYYGPGHRNGGNSEEYRNRSSSAADNGGIHNGGVSKGSGNGSSKHVGGNIHVGRINKGRIYSRGHNRSTINSHPGGKPGLSNPSGNEGSKGGRIINIRRKGNRRYRSNHGGNRKEAGNGGHISVRGNFHVGNNRTNGDHQGPNIHPGFAHNRRNEGPRKGNQTSFGVRKRGGYRSNRAGNRKGNGGHASVRRNGGSNRGINHGGLNKTRGNGAHQTPIGSNGGNSGGGHTGGKTPGASNGSDEGDSNIGSPGDNNHGNHSGVNSGHAGHGGNGSAGNRIGPDCKKEGGICGDPKVVGGDGVVFYFYGRKNHDFCLVSDSDLHINAHFIGTRPPGRTRDNTWVQALGFVFGPHTLTIAAKRNVSQWHNQVDHLEFSYNGEPLTLTTSMTSWASPDAAMTLTRIGAANSVAMSIKGKMEVSLTVVPISKKANLAHKYDIPEDVDCFAHLDMQFNFYNLSPSVNGVLGQTYQPGFTNPVNRSVAMPIMGGAAKFESASLLATDCKSSQYTASAAPVGSAKVNFHSVCRTSGDLPSGSVPGGITCHR